MSRRLANAFMVDTVVDEESEFELNDNTRTYGTNNDVGDYNPAACDEVSILFLSLTCQSHIKRNGRTKVANRVRQ